MLNELVESLGEYIDSQDKIYPAGEVSILGFYEFLKKKVRDTNEE